MIILGIDPGLATVGYGVIEKNGGNALKLIDYGIVTTTKDEMTPVRLARIHDAIKLLIEKHKPDAIAVEDLFFNTNITTGIRVAEARGVILLCAVMHNGNLYEYTPLQVKQTVSGNGRATKKQVQFMVKILLKLRDIPKPDDAADALAIAITHAQMKHSAREVF